jgi:hypothetical protein
MFNFLDETKPVLVKLPFELYWGVTLSASILLGIGLYIMHEMAKAADRKKGINNNQANDKGRKGTIRNGNSQLESNSSASSVSPAKSSLRERPAPGGDNNV